MNFISSPPVFPPEIFGCIVDFLVEDTRFLLYDPENLNAVKECSLVSKDFASLCQSYIFGVIGSIGFHGQERRERRLKKFTQTLITNPNLSRHVRELQLSFTESARRIRTLLYDMINTYTSGGTLRYLGVHGLDNVPEIRLGRIPLPSMTVPAPHITSLEIYSIQTLDLSFLSYFPNLENLSIRIVRTLIIAPSNCRAPSLQLKKLNLSLDTPGDVSRFVKFARLHRTDAFSGLQELSYEVPFEEDIEALEQILNEAKLLKVLHIDTSIDTSDMPLQYIFPLRQLQLPVKIPKLFSELQDLILSLRVGEYPHDYNTALSEVISIVRNLAHQNVIEKICIILETDFVGTTLPSPEPWSQIGILLASSAGFPRLKTAGAALFLEVNEDDLARMMLDTPAALAETQLEEFMLRAMPDLIAREGVGFSGRLYINQS
ncbi:hypothetical protein BJ165DRAFT_1403518 [Panaeolus papilionaceus]|nr:hypothetical protein BJ165DRAFT_1403518 [Panaeolus papilionaceus]